MSVVWVARKTTSCTPSERMYPRTAGVSAWPAIPQDMPASGDAPAPPSAKTAVSLPALFGPVQQSATKAPEKTTATKPCVLDISPSGVLYGPADELGEKIYRGVLATVFDGEAVTARTARRCRVG